MKTILFTAGPIPARLDSVKFITNRFKGGLAVKTAENLAVLGNKVTLVAWEHAEIKSTLPIIRVKDVDDYVAKVLEFEADAYVLAAAVANLGPKEPFAGKFPSHNYNVGDSIPIEFTIMPRVIDQIKKVRPRATLIGYKLFDGTRDELVSAAWHTLTDSKANLVFANHPAWAKERKIVLTPDGAIFDVDFDEHTRLIHRLVNETFYKTTAHERPIPVDAGAEALLEQIVASYPRTADRGMVFGTFAVRLKVGENAFATTTRGKKEGEDKVAIVADVDHDKHIVKSDRKATLNAPLLHKVFEMNPDMQILLHDHKVIPGAATPEKPYQFPGTTGDLENAKKMMNGMPLQMPHHGYIVGFKSIDKMQEFLRTFYPETHS
jgi:hypothetical protein